MLITTPGAELDVVSAKSRLRTTDGASVQLDGICEEPSILPEAWAHQGPPRPAQKYKVVTGGRHSGRQGLPHDHTAVMRLDPGSPRRSRNQRREGVFLARIGAAAASAAPWAVAGGPGHVRRARHDRDHAVGLLPSSAGLRGGTCMEFVVVVASGYDLRRCLIVSTQSLSSARSAASSWGGGIGSFTAAG